MADRLPWTERFEVGVPELDDDHRRLVAGINAFCEAAGNGEARESLRQRIDTLLDLAGAHFERENVVIARIQDLGGAQAARHEQEHATRLGQLSEVRSRLADEPGADDARELGDDLIDWFVQQAVGFDAQIRAYFVDR